MIKSLQITGYRFNHEKLHLLLNNNGISYFLPCKTCNINHFYTPLKSFLDSFRIQILSYEKEKNYQLLSIIYILIRFKSNSRKTSKPNSISPKAVNRLSLSKIIQKFPFSTINKYFFFNMIRGEW